MSRILCVGIAVLDVINTVDHYPQEDEELRARSQRVCRGGNAANTACVLSQFDHQVSLLCTLAQDPPGKQITEDLQQHGVALDHIVYIEGATTPASYITLNQQNGSRTIVHYRDLPELKAEQFDIEQTERHDWFHFEGRNTDQTEIMLHKLRRDIVDQPISIEIEKPRQGIERLFRYADILFFSRAFVMQQGYASANDFFNAIQASTGSCVLVCSWGEQGAYARDQYGNHYHSPAFPPARLVDTLGAGDTFNAGFINAMLDGQPVDVALISACRLAGRKVGQLGLADLTLKQ